MINNLPLFAGIVASILHVISGPDHLAAVTPLVIRTNKRAWKIGASWGIGHITGMLLIGILFLSFKEVIPVEAISDYSEQLVGMVLIVVGIWAFYRIFREKSSHQHPHVHTGRSTFVHIHKHDHDLQHATHEHHHDKENDQNIWTALGIGFIHGLAGVAHFLLLMPVLGFESTGESAQYIIGFAIGTLLAMTAYALILANLTKYTKQQHHSLFFKGIQFAGGLFAIIIGVYWLFRGH